MAINWDVNPMSIIATVLSVAGAGFTLMRKFYDWDRDNDRRHVQNTTRLDTISNDLREAKEDIKQTRTTQQECRELIGKTSERVALLEGRVRIHGD